jgi:hypothetical protein
MNTDGMTPVSETDTLEHDPDIRGQKFVCLSFISPEDVLVAKEPFMFNKFLSSFSQDMRDMFQNLAAYFEGNEGVLETINLVKERYDYIDTDVGIQKELEFFKEKNHDSLESEFLKRNNFRTSVRGIKVRGSYDSLEEAKARVENIRKFDNKFNVYVAQVGSWCPWSPSPNILEDQVYSETALNTLVKSYIENEELKKGVYENRKDDKMDKIKHDMEQRKDLWMAAKGKEDMEKGKAVANQVDQVVDEPSTSGS